MHRRLLVSLLGCFALVVAGGVARADTAYPARPVHVVVPFAAGGGTDLITRTLMEAVAPQIGAQIVIENKPGGGTTIGTLSALAAPADGYTLLAISNSFLVAPLIMPSAPYVWDRDFTGVSLFAVSPHVLVVNPKVPARTLEEFVAWGKAQNGRVTYASFGNGASNHLGFEVLKRKLGIEAVHIPYKGSAPALNDLVAGHVDAMLGDLQNVSQQIAAGTLRPIAVANETRLASMPELPTLIERGISGFTSKSIFGLVARTGTPPDIVARWSAALAEGLKRQDIKDRLGQLGLELVAMSPEQTNAFLAVEAQRSAEAVRQSGAKAD